MITQKGRVVYDRKKNFFRPSDLARILDSYTEGATGTQFGEFVWSVVTKAIQRQPRIRYFVQDFNTVILDKLVTRMEYVPLEKYFQALGDAALSSVRGSPPPEERELTPAELKRQLRKKGK